MPSKSYDALISALTQARAADTGEPLPVEEERHRSEQYVDLYRPVPGVTEEPLDGAPAGTLVMTPGDARDDLVIVHIHGGGFRTGSARFLRSMAAELALKAKARVVLAEYRLAPEHPYPAGLDDCEAVYLRTLELTPQAKVAVGGESAGANLAAALLLRRRDAGDERVLAGYLYAGVYDLRPENYTSGSWVDMAGTDAILTPASGPLMTRDYLHGHPPTDPFASPALAELACLPPLFLQTSGAELLLDDTLTLAGRAARAGVHVEMEIWPKMPHTWVVFGFLPEAGEALDRTVAFIHRIADGRVVDGAALSGGPATFEEAVATQK